MSYQLKKPFKGPRLGSCWQEWKISEFSQRGVVDVDNERIWSPHYLIAYALLREEVHFDLRTNKIKKKL